MLLVLLDNASAEYNFILRFFQEEYIPPPSTAKTPMSPMFSPGFDDRTADGLSELDAPSQRGHEDAEDMATPMARRTEIPKDSAEIAQLNLLWKQIMDPAMEYCQVSFFR